MHGQQNIKKSIYGVIHNSLTYFIKSAHLDGGEDLKMRPAYRKRNFLSLFVRATEA